jgi:uncharacterized membrane protein YphA (DoxX/SURF4 family)
MNIFLWVLQVLLAAAFLMHGWMFLFPSESMAAAMNTVIPSALRLFIGAAEVLAAIGLTLPGATQIRPWLVPLSAAGLMIVTLSATVFHVSRGETSSAMSTALLFALVTLLAYMRWRVRPIPPRPSATRATAA